MRSQKPQVIEYLFTKHWDATRRRLRKSTMTFSDVQKAIRHCNKKFGLKLSDGNPANFMKDVVRGSSASTNWPTKLKKLRYSAIQRHGERSVFEFIPYEQGQTEPFPNLQDATEDTPRFKIQSVSLPLAAKQLGRSDEPWLIQTAVNLRIIETHFGVVSDLPVAQLSHLQMSVKLRKTEIDALFLATCEEGSAHGQVIITCEAKRAGQRILEHQIVNQVKAAFKETSVGLVVPICIKAIKGVGFHLIEFVGIARDGAESLQRLVVSKEAIYELVPPVPGI